MIQFRKTIAIASVFASLCLGVAATATPAAAWDFQHRSLASGFPHDFQYWGPGIGGAGETNTYDPYHPCNFTNRTVTDDYGFTYYSTVRVCQ